MAETVSCRPVTTEVQVWSQATLYGVYGGQSGTGTDFFQELQFFVSITLPMLHIQ